MSHESINPIVQHTRVEFRCLEDSTKSPNTSFVIACSQVSQTFGCLEKCKATPIKCRRGLITATPDASRPPQRPCPGANSLAFKKMFQSDCSRISQCFFPVYEEFLASQRRLIRVKAFLFVKINSDDADV